MGAGGYAPKGPLAKPDEGTGTFGSVPPGTSVRRRPRSRVDDSASADESGGVDERGSADERGGADESGSADSAPAVSSGER